MAASVEVVAGILEDTFDARAGGNAVSRSVGVSHKCRACTPGCGQ